MSDLERAFLRRFSGAKFVVGSIVLALGGYMPLQLYIWFGPRDGNPIGLGLLAVAILPFAAAGVVVGLIKLSVEFFQGRRD
ncbi:MAG TPA: hypothetical protein VE175_15700 [Woeseiaceae bacterium]|jgi:hypothetical protein|nr:hypothetical protein [Woeseiaceae bacterium]